MVTIGIPVLNRYDLLDELLLSLLSSSVVPDGVYIIDNGGRFTIKDELSSLNIIIHSPGENLGVAKSWNWFIKNVKDIRIITNDDVTFYANSIEKLIKDYDEDYLVYPTGINGLNSFSCFMLPDKIINKVGLFDEEFFPAYYEDNSYHWRMKQKGFDIKQSMGTLVGHFGSATIKSYSRAEKERHDNQFRRNTELYKRMWGGLPGKEIYTEKFDNNEQLRTECLSFLKEKYGF